MTSGLETIAECQAAPEWLVSVISRGITVRGAYLSNAHIGRAGNFTSGPAILFTDAFATAWWVAGRLNGAGVQPELAIWVTNLTSESASGEIFGVNPAARRYTDWGSGETDQIDGEGLDPVQGCVGRIPES